MVRRIEATPKRLIAGSRGGYASEGPEFLGDNAYRRHGNLSVRRMTLIRRPAQT